MPLYDATQIGEEPGGWACGGDDVLLKFSFTASPGRERPAEPDEKDVLEGIDLVRELQGCL